KRTFTPNSANAVTVGFSAADVRYVRVQVTANTGWQAAQLSELEIRGEDDGGTDPGDPGTPPVTGTNLAKGKPVEANGYVHTF
ncbi:hypothetical protein G3I76_57170, partial [Streptomyces sp. SID11233]|nr:hypothetical protein [Streptomyces sp. SID11233]